MRLNKRALLAVAVAASIVPGCGRRQEGFRRIAVVAFDNLSGDAALEWRGRAMSEAIALCLTGTPRSAAASVAALADAFAAHPTHIVHGYITRRRTYASVEDTATHRSVVEASAENGSIAALAAELARQIDPSARALKASDESLRLFAQGDFEAAATLDPDFGPAYAGWAAEAVAKGDRASAERAITAARQRGSAIDAVEQARLRVIAARMLGNSDALRRALLMLAQAVPAESGAFRMLAAVDTAGRSFNNAARWYDEAIARDPEPELYNLAGYARAYAGDLDAAEARIGVYRRMRPAEANPLDSLGEIHYYFGRFAQAERDFLDSYKKDPSFLGGAALYKAAWARLRMGDLKAADGYAGRYFNTQPPERAALLRAQWRFVTGRRKEAFAGMERIPGPAAAMHLAVWSLEMGNRELAEKYAARVPQPSPAGVALRLVLAPDPQTASGPVAELALGYRAMLAGDPRSAVRHFTSLVRSSTPGSPDGAEILLAWALIEDGRIADARPLLARNPIPDAVGDHPFLPLIYPRLLELRERAGLPE